MKNPVVTWSVGLTAGILIGGFLFDGVGVLVGVLIGGSVAYWKTCR